VDVKRCPRLAPAPSVGTALEQRIKELCYAERYRDAESVLRELLDRLREVTLPDEKRIMRTLHNLACVLFQQSKLVSVPAGNDSALDSAAAVLRTLLKMQVSLRADLDEVQRTFGLTRECPACAAPYACQCTQPNGARGTRETSESRPFASHHDDDDTLVKVS
jgi:hypothetical protein